MLFDQMKAARARGRKVNFNWLWSKARAIQREQTGDDAAVVRQHVITTFCADTTFACVHGNETEISRRRLIGTIS